MKSCEWCARGCLAGINIAAQTRDGRCLNLSSRNEWRHGRSEEGIELQAPRRRVSSKETETWQSAVRGYKIVRRGMSMLMFTLPGSPATESHRPDLAE